MPAQQAIEARLRRQNEIMQELFNLGAEITSYPGPELSTAARSALTDAQVKAMKAREAEARIKDTYDAKRVEFDEVEQEFGFRFADDHRAFLARADGVSRQFAGIAVRGLSPAPAAGRLVPHDR